MRLKNITWRKTSSPVFVRKECTPSAPIGDLQKSGNELIMKIARKYNIPLLLTLDAHFVSKEQKIVQDLLLQNGRDEDSGLRFSTNYHQMNSNVAWTKWVDLHGTDFSSHFQEGVENNHVLASMCEKISFNKKYHLPGVNLPREVIELADSEEQKLKIYIYLLIDKNQRMVHTKEYQDRLSKEIDTIADNGKINLLPYFLALYEICEMARHLNIEIGAGRGSAGGCLLAYLLKITHIDPVKYNLSFERFLSTGRINRGKLPDIDIDFSEPEKVAEALKAKHGDRFVRICTTGTTKVKSAIRDVSRVVLDTKNNEVNKLLVDNVCKTISNVPQGFSDLLKWLYGWDDDEGHHLGEIENNSTLDKFFDENPAVQSLVEQVIGIPKSLGRHASAYCLSDSPINEIVPVCEISGEECTQFTMEAVESMGLVKFDLLGLNTLKDIRNCVKLIKERHNKEIDTYNIPEEISVFKEFAKGNTETVFQFNGPIPTKVCKQIKPKTILDLAAITAACRPGTMYALMADPETKMDTTLIDLWIQRRKGSKPVFYLHEDLKDILSTTHGIVLFQEQISAMFQKSCNYTPEQADEIREIIGKKKLSKMNEILPDIRNRLEKRGWTQEQISAFVSLCRSSSNYAFNLSHSVAYSYTAYICMWLKSHYPLEWWTSILQNSTHEDLEANAKYFCDVIKSPDVNLSHVDFYIIDDEDQKIVYPLTMIKGVKNASQEIFEKSPYKSFVDFYERIDKKIINKRVVSALIFSGALDKMPEAGDGTKADKRNRLNSFYLTVRKEKEIKKYTLAEIELMQSKSLCIGSPDIVDYFNSTVRIPCDDIPTIMLLGEGQSVTTAGLILAVKKIKTKNQEDMCFIDIGNKEHQISITCFPKKYQDIKDKLETDKIALVIGRINIYNQRKSILADNIKIYDLADITQ
jgi:DNA polymerase-3 subunit alpha